VRHKIKRFRRVAIVSTVVTYLLIFVGGLVRISGAGLGCPDWPKCFGRWIPPTDASQLPANIDPSLFNFTLAWIEYINRLLGMLVGLFILATAILAIMYLRKQKRILWPSVIAAILVAYQGWQGSQVVASNLEPLIITIHMVLAFIIVSIMIYVSQQAYYLENPEVGKDAQYPAILRKWVMFLWAIAIIQVILGTEVRSQIQIASEHFPLLSGIQLLSFADPISYIHGLLGVVVAVITWYAGNQILKRSENPTPLVSYGARIMMIIILVQITIGGILIGAGLPGLMRLYHLWVASLFIGILLLLYSALKRKEVVNG